MYERFDLNFEVPVDPQGVWDVFMDVERVASWVQVIADLREVVPLERYEALLEDRVGPFKVRADVEIAIDEVDQHRMIRARAFGEDRQVSSRIRVQGELSLRSNGRGSLIGVTGSYEIIGKIATLGAGSIRKKAEKVVDQFRCHAMEALGGMTT